MCGDHPAGGVKVKLFDEDSGPDPDDVLGWSTSEPAEFEILFFGNRNYFYFPEFGIPPGPSPY